MAYSLSNKCAKNLCKRTVLVQLIENVHGHMFFDTQCIELRGYTRSWKKFEDMFSRFDGIPACDRQTDIRTDKQTDILRRHSPRYA